MAKLAKKNGFTLVELAIVIVIIGFLVAGIAAGSNMIKQAELRSIITDVQSYQTAFNNFIGRYNAVPGDMQVGGSYFPNCAETPANCNGNGDGIVDFALTVGDNEQRGAWKQLSDAGMIGAGISQIGDAEANPGEITIGTRAPTSKISGAGYMITGVSAPIFGPLALGPSQFNGSSVKNIIVIGSQGTTVADKSLTGGALLPEEAFNIDQKLDDGRITAIGFVGALTGQIRTMDGNGSTFFTGCLNGGYVIEGTEKGCIVGFALD